MRPRTLVLTYHHVGDPDQTAPWVTASSRRFAEHMAFLVRSRLVISMDQLLADLRRGRVARGGHVVVTLDDATTDTFTTAFPILQRYHVPATVFVATGFIGSPKPFWWDRLHVLRRAAAEQVFDLGGFWRQTGFLDGPPWQEDSLWRPLRFLADGKREEALSRAAEALRVDFSQMDVGVMNWEQLAALEASGLITFGAHSVSHPVMTSLAEDQLDAEISKSRDTLAGRRAFRNVFAYPYGDPPTISPLVEAAVRRAGFEAAFTTTEVSLTGREEPMSLGRVCVDDMPLAEFRWLIDHMLCA